MTTKATSRSVMEGEVVEALKRVYDPCSLASGSPMNLIDMGLVVGWELDDNNNFEATFCVTSKSCIMAKSFVEGAKEELAKIPEIGSIKIDVDVGILWTEDMMSPEGLSRIQQNRERYLAKANARPQQWREGLRAEVSTP